jgi:4-amino-4-deoxy-L-arabinose transferase-like glycosyltransferase
VRKRPEVIPFLGTREAHPRVSFCLFPFAGTYFSFKRLQKVGQHKHFLFAQLLSALQIGPWLLYLVFGVVRLSDRFYPKWKPKHNLCDRRHSAHNDWITNNKQESIHGADF